MRYHIEPPNALCARTTFCTSVKCRWTMMSPTLTHSTNRNPTGYLYTSTSGCYIQHSSRLTHDLDDYQDKINALRECIRELEATPGQPTFAAVAVASGDKPLTRRDVPAPPAPMSASKKPVPVKFKVELCLALMLMRYLLVSCLLRKTHMGTTLPSMMTNSMTNMLTTLLHQCLTWRPELL